MVEVNEALTKKTAELARLELSDEEVKTFTLQLDMILKYVDQLSKVDVSGPDGKAVEPLTHPMELETPYRTDRVEPSPKDKKDKPKVLESAPDVLDDSFKVPPIL